MGDSPRHSVGTINHDEPLDEEDLPFDLLNSQEENELSQQSSSQEYLQWLQQQEQEESIDTVPSLFISVDLETGGEAVGIVQLSAVAFTLDGQHLGIFNEFVDPEVDSKYWSQAAIEVHGIKPSDVALADILVEVWPRFVEFCETLAANHGPAVMVAWSGSSCDLEWMFRVTEHGSDGLAMPPNLSFFVDPVTVLKHYTGCKLNTKHTGCNGYGLEETWCHIKQQSSIDISIEQYTNLSAHNSLADAVAQRDIVLDERFQKYLKDSFAKKTILPIDQLFGKKRKNAMETQAELTRNVPPGWKEDNTTSFHPNQQQKFTGSQGGGQHGPTSAMRSAVHNGDSITNNQLANMFLFFFPVDCLQEIACQTQKYAREDWVTKETARSQTFKHCSENDPNKRHRCEITRGTSWADVTVGYLLAWFAILVYFTGNGLKSPSPFWQDLPYGVPNPIVKNAMTRDRFEQLRRFIHFVDNSQKEVSTNNDPRLWKVQPIIDVITKNLQRAWTLGERIVIDESRIKYMGRAIAWVQYMPAKPIKHGIKVYALCCAYTGFLSSFEIYVDGSAKEVVERLLKAAGLIGGIQGVGRILYCDNWYTSMELVKYLWLAYGFFAVGTYVLTKKKSRAGNDFPFAKLSNGAMKTIARGWSRRATQEIPHNAIRGKGMVQGTLWRDKKVVGYLHTHKVERTTESTKVRRYSKSDREHTEINALPVSSDYSKYMKGVDRMDRDNADWSVSIRTNRWYLRIFFWLLDCVVFGTYLVATNLGDEEWNKNYKEKYNGRRRFQVDLAMALFEEGLTRDWNGDLKDDKGRPKWCRQKGFMPCNCGVCFFCKHGHTAGIDHGKKTVRPKVMQCVDKWKSFKANSQGCAVCRKKLRKAGDKRKLREIEKVVKRTIGGCPVCNTVVCKGCWSEFMAAGHSLEKISG